MDEKRVPFMNFKIVNAKNFKMDYRNGLSKTAPEFKNCEQQLFTLTMCLPACL